MVESCGFKTEFFFPQPFSFAVLPWLYKMTALHPLLQKLSATFAWLGRVFPALFSPRLFIVVRA